MNNNPNNQNNQTIEQSAFWCPSLGVGKLPSGFDGVEPAKRTDYEQIIADVFHKCNEAFVNSPVERDAQPGYFRIVVGDIADALASVVPAERTGAVREGHEGNADLLYEISVDHDNSTAVIERDGEMLYTIKTLGLSHRRALHAAIQVLRAHLHENDGEHRRHRLSRNRRACGILTPAEELKETVKRQKEEA